MKVTFSCPNCNCPIPSRKDAIRICPKCKRRYWLDIKTQELTEIITTSSTTKPKANNNDEH